MPSLTPSTNSYESMPRPSRPRNASRQPVTSMTAFAVRSAQDMELVSALMSMKSGMPHPRASSLLPSASVMTPHSPTRVSDDVSRGSSQAPAASTAVKPHPVLQSDLHAFAQPQVVLQVLQPTLSILAPEPSASGAVGPAAIRYTPEQRKEAVRRFKEKKLRRKNRTGVIRYEVRKRLADTRPRFRGRFFKPNSEIPDVKPKDVGRGRKSVA